ncbi:MAG: hypothetical protein ABIT04_02870 [Novosphingobium sp.]
MRIDFDADRAISAGVTSRREARPWLPLLNAVLGLAGSHAQLLSHGERAWASITFAGSRHTIALTFAGEDGAAAAEAFIAALPEHEFSIRGRLVADATVVSVDHALLPAPSVTVQAEFLLLDDG